MKMVIDQLKFNKDTKLYPMVGYPAGQSTAPFAYNPLFVANGINEIMWPVEVPPGGLGEFLKAARVFGMRHIGLTMPHKAAVIPFLDEVEEQSRIFNSVNTIRIDGDGKTHGIGLDGRGNMAAIRAAGVDVKGMHVMNLGAGSIVGVILLELAKAGARKVTILNRNMDHARTLAETVKRHTDMEIECLPPARENLDRLAPQCGFVMQATPLGMLNYPGDHEYLGFMDRLGPDAVLMECIVNPPATTFVKEAEARGLKAIRGLEMMLCQIGEIFEYAFGFPPKPGSLEESRKTLYGYFGLPQGK